MEFFYVVHMISGVCVLWMEWMDGWTSVELIYDQYICIPGTSLVLHQKVATN